ncbi:MAG: HmuY family protein [Bacteroidota bacterium]
MRNQLLLLSTLFVFAACKKEKYSPDPVPDPFVYSVVTTLSNNIVTVRNLPADTIIGMTAQGQPYGAGKYSFFSLETGQWISNADSNTTKWDLAFAGTVVRVNNATSGPGAGGAFVYNGTFESLTSVPSDSVFRVDNHPISYAIPRGSGKAWYTYDGPSNLLTPIPGRTLVIRTANGQKAKVEVINYYRGGVTPSATAPDSVKINEQRYYTFRYTKF